MPFDPSDRLPYEAADFHISPSCRTEFGYDDAGRSHAELHAAWLQRGASWWSPVDPIHEGWNPYLQLDNLIEKVPSHP